MADLTGTLMLDAQTFLAGGGSTSRSTFSLFVKSTVATVFSYTLQRNASLVYFTGNNAALVSWTSGTYAAQTAAAGINPDILAFNASGSTFWIGNHPIGSGVTIYICYSTAQLGMLVFAFDSQ